MKIEYTKNNPLRCFFAFEGYNSQGLGLNRLKRQYPDFDWICVGRSEIDKYAIQAADVLFPEAKDKNYGDIRKIDWAKVPDFDLFTYSFPCTNISVAGLQQGLEEGSGTASSLLWECRKVIEAKRPKYLLMENVKALVSYKFMPCLLKWQHELESYGYSNFAKVLNSKDFGIPQNRERVFMVSILDCDVNYHFPEPFPLVKRLKDVLERNVDERYYLSKKMIDYLYSLGGKDETFIRGKGIDDGSGIATTCTANYYKMPGTATFIKEPVACAMRGREPQCLTPKRTEYGKQVRKDYESGKLDESRHNMQQLEPRKDGVCNTITSIQKDNLIIEPKVLQVGNINNNGNFDNPPEGISPTIDTMGGGNLEPKIIIGSAQKNAYIGSVENVSPCITAACGMGGGQIPMILGVSVNPNRVREYGDGKIHDVVSMCITTQEAKNTSFVYQSDSRIRKLTPRECFRLQGVDDTDIDKIQAVGISRSQQYKLAGNSIVVNVLYHIFRKLFVDVDCESAQLTLF